MLLLQTVRPCRLSWKILRILRKISCKCCTFPGCGPAAQVSLWTLCGFPIEARFRLKLLPSVGLADSAALPQHIAHYSLSSAEWSGSAAFLRTVRLGRTIARFEVLRILRRTWHAFGHNCCRVLPNCTRCGPCRWASLLLRIFRRILAKCCICRNRAAWRRALFGFLADFPVNPAAFDCRVAKQTVRPCRLSLLPVVRICSRVYGV